MRLDRDKALLNLAVQGRISWQDFAELNQKKTNSKKRILVLWFLLCFFSLKLMLL